FLSHLSLLLHSVFFCITLNLASPQNVVQIGLADVSISHWSNNGDLQYCTPPPPLDQLKPDDVIRIYSSQPQQNHIVQSNVVLTELLNNRPIYCGTASPSSYFKPAPNIAAVTVIPKTPPKIFSFSQPKAKRNTASTVFRSPGE
uniref:Fibronectin type-III domain-containing protein n=1 Tax=Seriola lalandi dorsalis TaxID=1841481 RepID=A0A3B4WJQ3_SERLL